MIPPSPHLGIEHLVFSAGMYDWFSNADEEQTLQHYPQQREPSVVKSAEPAVASICAVLQSTAVVAVHSRGGSPTVSRSRRLPPSATFRYDGPGSTSRGMPASGQTASSFFHRSSSFHGVVIFSDYELKFINTICASTRKHLQLTAVLAWL